MKRIYRLTEESVPPLFGEQNNPTFTVKYDELSALPDAELVCDYPGIYCVRANDEYLFDHSRIIKKQRNRSNTGFTYFVACERIRDGKTNNSWINLNYFLLKDVYGTPIMPGWYELGSMEARVNELVRRGQVKCITKMVTLSKDGKQQVSDVGIIPWGEKEKEILTTVGLADTTVGNIILWDTPEDIVSLLWTITDKKVKFEAPSSLEQWPFVLSDCIGFIRIVQGLRHYYDILKDRYFFKTNTKLFYSPRTFSISFNRNTYTIILNTGICFPTGTEWNYLMNCSSYFRDYLNDLVYQMQQSLPRGRAVTLLEECKNIASLHSAKMKLLGEM